MNNLNDAFKDVAQTATKALNSFKKAFSNFNITTGENKMKYNKLVRNEIPEIIAQEGKTVSYRILNEEEYKVALEEKLDEEVIEYHDSKSVEEIADIEEVLNEIIRANGHNRFEVFIARMRKKILKGGFTRRVFLEEVKDDDKKTEVLDNSQASL